MQPSTVANYSRQAHDQAPDWLMSVLRSKLFVKKTSGQSEYNFNKTRHLSNTCGSVDRAVASNSRGPRFESSHPQKNYIEH